MSPGPASALIYRFASVEFDAGAFQLRVGGSVRQCPTRVLRLLQLLCAAPRRLYQRDELIAALWPERRLVSDESLGQLVFKLRAALDEDAACIVTVRGAGLRLDAEVSATPSAATADSANGWTREELESPAATPVEIRLEPASAPASDAAASAETLSATPPSAATPAAMHEAAAATAPRAVPPAAAPEAALLSPAHRRGFRGMRFFAALAGLVLLAVVAGLWRSRMSSDDDAVLRAWGFAPQQIHAARPDTRALLQSALAADAAGDRARAQVMLSAIHNSDPGTPLPALLLAAWRAGAGDRPAAEQWLAAAAPRVQAGGDAVAMTWLDFVRALAQSQSSEALASLSALLERDPGAWILRHIRAQLYQQRGQPEAALADLQRIDIAALTDRRLEDVLAARAALGDRAGAEAVYARLDARVQPVGHAAVGALLAWSAGDLPRSRHGFAETAALARRDNRDDWTVRAELLAAVLAYDAGDIPDARRRLAEAVARAREKREILAIVDAELIRAQVAAAAGEPAESAGALHQALEAAAQSGDVAWSGIVEVVALRLDVGLSTAAAPGDNDLMTQGLVPLLQARVALRAGERERARSVYQQAPAPLPILREEYAALARDLELPWTLPPRPNPPGPPYFRLITAMALARAPR